MIDVDKRLNDDRSNTNVIRKSIYLSGLYV